MGDDDGGPERLKYAAFLSYSHHDRAFVARVHSILERHPLPRAVRGDVPAPRRIFMDREELAVSSDLGTSLREAIRSSRTLVVFCSKASAESKWVSEEIRTFCESHGPKGLLLVSIEPSSPTPMPAGIPSGWDGLISSIPRRPKSRFRDESLRLLAGILEIDYEVLRRRLAARARIVRTVQTFALLLTTIVAVFVANLTQQNNELIKKNLAEQRLRAIDREATLLLSSNQPAASMAALASALELVGSFGPDAVEELGPDFTHPPPAVTNVVEKVLGTGVLYGARHVLPEHVFDLRFSPDGSLMTANIDGSASAWDTSAGSIRYDMRGHRGYVSSITMSTDGTRVATVSDDGTARIWDSRDGAPVHVLAVPTREVDGISFSPDGRWIATGMSDGTVRVWSAETGEESYQLDGHPEAVDDVMFSPDGKALLTWATAAAVWDLSTRRVSCLEKSHDDWITEAEFSPDGEMIITGSQDGTARQWSRRTCDGRLLERHRGSVNAVSYSPDGTSIATASTDRIVRIFDSARGELEQELEGHSESVNDVAFSPRGDVVATVGQDRTVRLWKVGSGRVLHVLTGHTNAVRHVAFSPDGRQVASGSDDDTVRVWEAVKTDALPILEGHTDRVNTISSSAAGDRIVTASDDGTARVWDGSDGHDVHTLASHGSKVSSAVFSRDGTLVVTASRDGTARIWSSADGSELRVFEIDYVVNSVDISPDQSRIVTANGDKTAFVWSIESGKVLRKLDLPDHCYDVAYSHDGARIATASRDDTVRIWDAETGRQLVSIDAHSVSSVEFSPDDRRLLTVGRFVSMWDPATGQSLFRRRSDEDRQPLLDARFSPDGRTILAAWKDQPARVLDAATGANLYSIGTAGYGITALGFSPDGTRAVVASDGSDPAFYRLRPALEGCEALTGFAEHEEVAAICARELRLHDGDRVRMHFPHEGRLGDFGEERTTWLAVMLCHLLLPAAISFSGLGSGLRGRISRLIKNRTLADVVFVVSFVSAMFWLALVPLVIVKPRGHGDPAIGYVVSLGLVAIAYWIVRKTGDRWWMWGTVVAVPVFLASLLISPAAVRGFFFEFDTIVPPQLASLMVSIASVMVGESGGFEAHVVAHAELNHLLLVLSVAVLVIPLAFYAASRAFAAIASRFEQRVGSTAVGDAVSLPLLVFVFNAIAVVVVPVFNEGLRYLEREADRHALEQTHDGRSCATAAMAQYGADRYVPRPGLPFSLWATGRQSLADRTELCNGHRPWDEGLGGQDEGTEEGDGT